MMNAVLIQEWICDLSSKISGSLSEDVNIAWVERFSPDLQLDEVPNDWLLIAATDDAESLCEYPGIPAVIACDGPQERRNKKTESKNENAVWVQTDISAARFAQILQMRLFRIMKWKEKLSDIVARRGNLQDLVDASEEIFGNYMTISDWNFRLIAHTKTIEIEDKWIEELVENGYHSKASIDRFRNMGALKRWAKQSKTRYSSDDHFTKYPIINHVFHLGGYRFIQMVMSCNHVDYTDGLMYLFETFVGFAKIMIENRRPMRNQVIPTETTFLLNLIDGDELPRSFIEAQASCAGIDTGRPYWLYEFEVTPANDDHIGYLIGEMNMAFKEPSIIRDESRLFVLLQEEQYGPDHERFEQRLNDLAEDYSIRVGVSDELESLDELDLAYRQTSTALKFGNAERFEVIHFADHLYHLLIRGIGDDERFIKVCIRGSFLDTIKRDDAQYGTNDAGLLKTYLECERRIVPTAHALQLHRNTVSQRIKNLLGKYELDLDIARNRQYARAIFAIDELL